ncbi:MAG: hypothetical protein ABIH21_03815 [Patescibacteria group bacterium]
MTEALKIELIGIGIVTVISLSGFIIKKRFFDKPKKPTRAGIWIKKGAKGNRYNNCLGEGEDAGMIDEGEGTEATDSIFRATGSE